MAPGSTALSPTSANGTPSDAGTTRPRRASHKACADNTIGHRKHLSTARRFTTAMLCGVACMAFTTGCWDMKELNNRAIVISSAIDCTEDGRVVVTDQFANPMALGRTVESPPERFYTMSAAGDTILGAAQELQTRLPRYVFIGHRRNIFIGENTAKKGLQDVIDEFTRSPDSRIRTDMSVVKDASGADVLKIPSLVEKLPSIAALKSRSVVGGGQPGSTYVDFLMAAASKTSCPTLPMVTIATRPTDYMSGAEDKQLQFSGRAVFNKHLKMVGEMSYPETVYRFWEIGQLTHQTFTVKVPDTGEYASIYTNHMRTDIVPKLQGNHLSVALYMRADGRIAESRASLNLSKKAAVEKVRAAMNHKVEDDMLALIGRVQREYHTDVFRFDHATQMRYPDIWPKLAANWPQVFSDATVHVYADIQMETVGEVGAPLHQHVEM